MDWKAQLAKAEALFEKAKALLADPDATAEEKSHLEDILTDARKLKTEALQYKAIIDEVVESKAVLALPSAPDSEPASVKTLAPTDALKFTEWGEYLEAIWLSKAHNIPDERLTWFKDDVKEGKALAGNVGARGGFLIPTQFIPQLQAVMAEDSLVRKFATIIRMTGRQIAIPVLDQTQALGAGIPNWFGGMRFYWADEGELKTETDATFKRVNLVAKKLIGHTNASDELLDDSAISLGDFLSGPLGFAGGIAWMEDYAFLRGVGGGQPRGVVAAPVTLAPARAAAGAVSYADCVTMLSQLLPSARARWCISQSVMASMIQMTGPAGNPSYVWQPNAREGVPGYLFGLPVHWTEKLPALGTRGDILLADFRYYLIGDRQATTIESSNAPRWIYDETTWRAVHRCDGQPWLSAPLTYQDQTTQVSPFVVLSGPTS